MSFFFIIFNYFLTADQSTCVHNTYKQRLENAAHISDEWFYSTTEKKLYKVTGDWLTKPNWFQALWQPKGWHFTLSDQGTPTLEVCGFCELCFHWKHANIRFLEPERINKCGWDWEGFSVWMSRSWNFFFPFYLILYLLWSHGLDASTFEITQCSVRSLFWLFHGTFPPYSLSRHETMVQLWWFSNFWTVHFYSFAFPALHSTTPAASIWFISDDVKPYSSRTLTVCSPITGSGARLGSAGVRERTGAGRGLSSPLESFMKEALAWLCGCELTCSKDNTGVTQASVPSKTFDQSTWVFVAKRSVKIRLRSGQSLKLIWGGKSSASNSKPMGRKKET